MAHIYRCVNLVEGVEMSKKPRRIKIAATKPEPFDFQGTLREVADTFMSIERILTPRIIETQLEASAAIMLIAMHGDAAFVGAQKEHTMTQEEISKATNVLLMLWKKNLFVPSEDYPFTLEQTLAKQEGE